MAGQRAAPVELARRRARRVALTLLAQGEPIDTVERALHSGGFHPALAHEAVRWARDRKRELDDDADLASLAMSRRPRRISERRSEGPDTSTDTLATGNGGPQVAAAMAG